MRPNRIPFALLFIGLLGAMAGCTTTTENSGPADGDAPQATLETLLQGDVTSTKFPARLARIDGQTVSSARRTYPLTPGSHTFSIELDIDAIKQYESESGRYKPKPSRVSADLREKQVTVDVIAGERYKFGAEIEDFDYTNWKPFVVKADELK